MSRIRAKTIGGRCWQPKTKRNRAVPISRALRTHFDRHTPPASDNGWFFPSPWGMWWDRYNFSDDLRKANKDAGLPWTCLDYRHTSGSQLAQCVVSLYKTSELNGGFHRKFAEGIMPPLLRASFPVKLSFAGCLSNIPNWHRSLGGASE